MWKSLSGIKTLVRLFKCSILTSWGTQSFLSALHFLKPHIILQSETVAGLRETTVYLLTNQSVALNLWEVGCIRQDLSQTVDTMTFIQTKDYGVAQSDQAH